MKVLKQGRSPLVPVWLGKVLSCVDCKAQFELEAGDHVGEISDPRDGDYFVVRCPTCRHEITFSKKLVRT